VRQHTAPHFLLLTQAQSTESSDFDDQTPAPCSGHLQGGIWKFVLEEIGGSQRVEVSETEPGVWGERLQLLAVVRGLEALEQPSKVTLITPSRFVGNGIRNNLAQWRESRWQWEHFGEMTQIKNVDLWKRIDQAMQYHQLDCRIWDFQSPEVTKSRPAARLGALPSNKITFEQIQQGRVSADQSLIDRFSDSYRIKPIGRGRAFGLYNPSALSTVSFTG
jgi:ribonuclease HI